MKRIFLAGLLGFVAAIGLLSPVDAHAIVVRTEPADGAVLDRAPSEIKLWFTEAILLDFTTIEIVDGEGKHMPALVTRALPDQSSDRTWFGVLIRLPELAPNAYRLSWRAIANDDLHASSGAIVFGVQHAVERSADTLMVPTPSPLEVGLRWLNLGALAGVIGALASLGLIFPTLPLTDAHETFAMLRRRVITIALMATAIAFFAGIGMLLTQAATAGDAWWSIVTQTGYGWRTMARAGVIVVLFGFLVRLAQPSAAVAQSSDSTVNRIAAFACLGILAILESLNSHVTTGNSFVSVLANTAHLLAAGVWGGGLLIFALTLVPLLRGNSAEHALARSVLRRFGALAATSLGVLVVTGIYISGIQVASVDALLVTLYGQTLLIKVGLALTIASIGLGNAMTLHPRVAEILRAVLHRPANKSERESRRLGGMVLLESIGALGIILLAACLGATAPARGPEFDPPGGQAALIPSLSTHVADLFVTFSIKPNRPGQNFIDVGVFDTRRPAPAPIERVTLQLRAPGALNDTITLDATRRDNAHYEFSGDAINISGAWNVDLVIVRRGLPAVTKTIPWTVYESPASNQTRPVWISNQPLAPILTWLASAILFLLSGVFVVWGLRRPTLLPRSVLGFTFKFAEREKDQR
ncbi:MAG: copper resistance protein CopC/CopD [Chloroflexi bacterium]|nr:copper resistance protein CopC/CopD [Chloroflexota bacterium]